MEILLVEDNPSDVELTLHNPRRHKLANHIEVARDGAEALAKLHADPRTASIPVVMLTSSREERDIVESDSLWVNSYIVKPVDFEQFSQTIRQLGLYWLVVNQPPPG